MAFMRGVRCDECGAWLVLGKDASWKEVMLAGRKFGWSFGVMVSDGEVLPCHTCPRCNGRLWKGKVDLAAAARDFPDAEEREAREGRTCSIAYDEHGEARCSLCGESSLGMRFDFDYCPGCGARIERGE